MKSVFVAIFEVTFVTLQPGPELFGKSTSKKARSFCNKPISMGEAEIDHADQTIIIHSHIVTYGSAANEEVTERIKTEIETMWNEPKGTIYIKGMSYGVAFKITAEYKQTIEEEEVLAALDPRNNYFRIEEYAHGNISFVDGIGCNSGYFLLENLYTGSTTAAHEYGHTLGLEHPADLDLRGKGIPSIMYPRGTLVDPQFQYDPSKSAGVTGGTMHPMYRKVFAKDIASLALDKLRFINSKTIIGDFTNVYHEIHKAPDPGEGLSGRFA